MARLIAFVGGGTMGPTAPLLALHDYLSKIYPRDKYIWIGTEEGPERAPVEARGIPFMTLPSAKIPRYFSIKIFTWPFDYLTARKQARAILDEYKPNMVIGAGGFTQVPLIRAASRRGIPCLIHQLDFQPGWSNLAVAKECKFITTTFTYHVKKFAGCKNEKQIATPNRFASLEAPEPKKAKQYFGFDPDRPVLLVIGGGTGSRALNHTTEKNIAKWLEKVQVLHITGRGRSTNPPEQTGYKRFEFLDRDELLQAYSAADIVISRAGMGGITDLATLSKATILVPIPKTHQEKNTRHLPIATIEVKESENLFDDLYKEVLRLLKDPDKRKKLGYELHRTVTTDDGREWAQIIERYLPEDLE
ncbi:MAG: UDP-N-acetylglucosamine--N-acetylmuramyl-(pentapeptide) pyrophosphoryl-undecaprenol N-acetylglucosamine transferase [Patescibacteria group bacterium]